MRVNLSVRFHVLEAAQKLRLGAADRFFNQRGSAPRYKVEEIIVPPARRGGALDVGDQQFGGEYLAKLFHEFACRQ